ncbi:MAG: polysaccharide deacetylase family protein [Acidobacteriota bacterium]
MVLIFMAAAAVVTALAHTAPFPFVLDGLYASRVVWRMPHAAGPPTIYLTFDDGPNPTATPALLDLLRDEGVPATFFLLERHLTPDTSPLVRRMAEEGHAIGLHSHTRGAMLRAPRRFAAELTAFAGRLQGIAGVAPCRLFRPHAGWRGAEMLKGLAEADYRLAGWSWMQWDFDFFRPRSVRIVPRLVAYASPGDIVVIHDGHHENPRADRRYAVDVVRALVPALRARGFTFGRLCEMGRP